MGGVRSAASPLLFGFITATAVPMTAQQGAQRRIEFVLGAVLCSAEGKSNS